MVAAAVAVLAADARAQPAAVGQAKLVVRTVHGVIGPTRRPLAPEEAVFWQELIETGSDSAARFQFLDETTLTTGPNSRVRIDEDVYAGSRPLRRRMIDLAFGVLRCVTGPVAADHYAVRTPQALIGVRGTDFTVRVAADGTTAVLVRAGQVSVEPSAAPMLIIEAGQRAQSTGGDGPFAVSPVQADDELVAEETRMSALLAIAGDGDAAAAVLPAAASVLFEQRGQAASARAQTQASQAGAACSGC